MLEVEQRSALRHWHQKRDVLETEQEAQLSPSDRAMRLVSSNLANYHATVQKLLIRQVLTNRWYEVGGLVGGNVS